MADVFYRRRERVLGERVVPVTGSGGGKGETQAMGQQTQQWRSGKAEMAWLSALVGTMETVSRMELGATPCSPSLLAAVEARLAHPAMALGLYGSNFSLRN